MHQREVEEATPQLLPQLVVLGDVWDRTAVIACRVRASILVEAGIVSHELR